MLCTVSEFGEWLSEYIERNVLTGGKRFPDCDFAIVDGVDATDLKETANKTGDWYGIKAIDAGFDSDLLMLISDYYGGGCASMCTISQYDTEIAESIAEMVLDSLISNGVPKANHILIVEFAESVDELPEVNTDVGT